MSPAAEPLPNDFAALRAMLVEVRAERDAERAEKARLAAECGQPAAQNDRLRHLIRQLQRLQFGRRSEKCTSGRTTSRGTHQVPVTIC
jgi:transposase